MATKKLTTGAAILRRMDEREGWEHTPERLAELREQQSQRPVKTVKAKGKRRKVEPKVDPLTESIREYERVSYYLAAQGDFDFTMDGEAQELFHTFEPENAFEIDKLTQLRVETFGKRIPKGLHIDGLTARTNERIRRNALAKKKGKKS